MNNVKISVNNGNNPDYENMFNDLVQEVFKFSFSPWFERKLWDENYESYSIIEDGKMLANMCVYKSEMIVCGEVIRANQFGTVATRKSERGKGLSRILMEHVLSLYPDNPTYLSANPSVIDFYPRFGFRQVQTHKPEVAVEINNNPSRAIKYKLGDPEFVNAFNNRGFHSKMLDCINSQSIQMFHLLMEYGNDIYYLPNLDVIVIAQQEDNRLFLADVIAKKPVAFDLIKKELPFDGVGIVEFGFYPDWLDVTPTWIPESKNEDPFFIKGEWNLPGKYRFPAMSQT